MPLRLPSPPPAPAPKAAQSAPDVTAVLVKLMEENATLRERLAAFDMVARMYGLDADKRDYEPERGPIILARTVLFLEGRIRYLLRDRFEFAEAFEGGGDWDRATMLPSGESGNEVA